jgi:hypothetical protein
LRPWDSITGENLSLPGGLTCTTVSARRSTGSISVQSGEIVSTPASSGIETPRRRKAGTTISGRSWKMRCNAS